jgi:predicted RNase H-like HicB family nuclease
MITTYPAIFYKDESGYSAIFPDLNFLATSGGTFDTAQKAAAEILAFYLYGLKKDGAAFPNPSEITDIDPKAVAEDLGFYDENMAPTVFNVRARC